MTSCAPSPSINPSTPITIRLKQASAAQPGLIAEQELDDAQSKDLASAAQVDAAKSALAAAQKQSAYAGADNERVHDLEAYTNVTAPLNGVIVWRYADTGALIQAGTTSDVQSLPLVKLSQSDLLRLRLPVPEDAVQYIHEGDEVQVRVDAVNRTFTGKVVRFTRDVSLATRTMETEIDVPNTTSPSLPACTPTPRSSLRITTTHSPFPCRPWFKTAIRPAFSSSMGRIACRFARATRDPKLVARRSAQRTLQEGEQVITGGQATTSRAKKSGLSRRNADAGGRVGMPKFALKYPFFIIMLCLVIAVVGITTIVADAGGSVSRKSIFPVVVVATFYSGMPPEQIEADITDTFERFFTLGSNIDHIESRSLTGVSLIKIYFKPGTDRQRRAQQHRQPGHGRSAAIAARHAAARRAGAWTHRASRFAWSR